MKMLTHLIFQIHAHTITSPSLFQSHIKGIHIYKQCKDPSRCCVQI